MSPSRRHRFCVAHLASDNPQAATVANDASGGLSLVDAPAFQHPAPCRGILERTVASSWCKLIGCDHRRQCGELARAPVAFLV